MHIGLQFVDYYSFSDPLGIKFFREKYLLAMDKHIMVIPACLHCVHEHLMSKTIQ